MSGVDERVVGMRFDNQQFERGVKQTNESLERLKQGLNLGAQTKGLSELSEAGSRFNLANISSTLEGIAGKFQAMGVIAITALAAITAAAVSTGLQLARSLTIAPISEGLADYHRKLTSVQTVMNATGRSIEEVGGFFNQLDAYADLTIYKLSDMTTALSKFVNAGVKLETAIPAIKGISNMVALAGQDANAASIAYYNLSQSISNGFLTRMDFKSLELANVATKEFKDYLTEAAVAAGTLTRTTDGMFRVVASGSDKAYTASQLFVDGLQEGWATTGILLDVFNDYGDATTVIGKKAQAAAQDVKSFPMMMDTLRASVGTGWTETFELLIGNLEESKVLFTGLTGTIQKFLDYTSELRNIPLGDWKELGGRELLIEALGNAFKEVIKVIDAVRKGLEDIFPPITGRNLLDITEAIHQFSESLHISQAVLWDIRRTARGFFAVLDIGWMILKQVVKTVAELLGFTLEGSAGILDFTGNIGDFFVALRDAIKEGDGLAKVFEGIGMVLKIPITLLKGLIAILGVLFEGFNNIEEVGFEDFIDRVAERLQPLTRLGEFLTWVWTGFLSVIGWVAEKFAPLALLLSEAFSELGTLFNNLMSGMDFKDALDVLNAGLMGGILALILNFFRVVNQVVRGGGGGFLGGFVGIMDQLQSTLFSFQNSIRAKTLLSIAAAVALLAASVLVLSLIDSVKLASALTGLTVMFGQLVGMLILLEKSMAAGGFLKLPVITFALISLGIAMNFFALAVRQLAGLSWAELVKGLVGLTAMLGAVVATAKLLSGSSASLISGGIGLIFLATGIKILASAVTDIAGLSWGELGRGVSGVTVLLGLLVGFARTVGNPAGIVSTAVSMILLGAALKILASALQDFSSMTWDEIGRGMTVLAGSLIILTLAMRAMQGSIIAAASFTIIAAALNILSDALIKMSAMSWDDIGRVAVVLAGSLLIIAGAMYLMTGALPGAAALIIVAFSLNIMADAFLKFTQMSWDDIGRAAVILAGSLLIIAGAMYLMTGALPGAAALTVVAIALAVLTPVLKALGKMSLEEIGRALLMLSGVFVVLGIAGYALTPVVPTLFALAGALLLLGVATLAAGVGIMALGIGLTALGVAGAAGTAGLVAMVAGLLGLIPMVFKQVGEGIVILLQVIAESAGAIIEAIVIIGTALLDALIQLIPKIVEAASVLITELVTALITLIPFLVDAGLKILTGILDGIANNIEDVAEAGVNVAQKFIEAFAKEVPELADTGFTAVTNFMNALAVVIDKRSTELGRAGGNLARALFDGFVKGIGGFLAGAFSAGEKLGQSAVAGAKKGTNSHSPSKATEEIGMWMGQGLVKGTLAYISNVFSAGEKLGDQAVSGVKTAMSKVAEAVSGDVDMTPVIRPVLDLSGIQKDASLISGMIKAPTLNVDANYASAASISSSEESEKEARNTETDSDDTSDSNVTFIQNINSPKAISRADTYRQTKNLLSVAGKELTDAK